MPTAVLIFVVITTIGSVATVVILHFRHLNSAEAVWSRRVLDRLRRHRVELDRLLDPDRHDEVEERRGQLRDDWLSRYRRTIPVARLTSFPGIGPGTVDAIRLAGGRTLEDLVGFQFDDLPGVGPVKKQILVTAFRELMREARSEFDSGRCAEYREYQLRLSKAKATDRDEELRDEERIRELEKDCRVLRPMAEVARRVSFWRSLFGSPTPGLTEELMRRPLP